MKKKIATSAQKFREKRSLNKKNFTPKNYKKFSARMRKFLKLEKVKIGVFEFAWLIAPIAIWFSFHPVISFGQNDSMNFELSITLIFVAILALLGLPKIWRGRRELLKNKAVWLATIFVIWNGLSVFWSANLARAILTFGIVGALGLIFLAAISERENLKKILPAMTKILILSGIIISIFSWLQAIADIFGVSESITGMCAGCRANLFGFPRFTAFAAEPQFFGSLLILPILLILNKMIRGEKFCWRRGAIFLFLFVTMLMTMSRGAVYALACGVLILLFIHKKQFKKWGICVVFMLVGLMISLGAQGVMAVINPRTAETFRGAVTKSIHQWSLGVIDLRNLDERGSENALETDSSDSVNSNDSADSAASQNPDNDDAKSEPIFDGYVEISTDQRLAMSGKAIETWRESAATILFGVGTGGSAAAITQQFPNEFPRDEIVNNEFLEILLELGLFGAAVFGALIVGLFYKTRQQKVFWAILVAFLAQWNFFSGYPNALHVYLILIVIFAATNLKKS